ncbi:MAG: amino acid adenylation domain-containing protein, partial [Litoreibacter sp.]
MVIEVIRKAQEEGLQLYVEEGRLKYRARADPPSESLTKEIKQNKAGLIAALTSQSKTTQAQLNLRATGKNIAPLTKNQMRVFYQGTAFDTGDTYIMEVAYCFDGLLEPKRLEAAFLKIIERHHILRSRFFVDESGTPVQQVLENPADSFALSVNQDTEAEEWLHVRSDARCDLSKGHILNVALLHSGENSYLHIACHHIAFDGWSYQILFAELAEFYEDMAAALPRPALQYVDYANAPEAQHWSEESQDYWRANLRGAASFNGLPADKPRARQSSFSGQSLRRQMPVEIEQNLAAFAVETGVSPFSAYLAAFYVQVSRFTRDEDCVIGTPMSGRILPQLDGMIGFFANALPLRVQVDHDLSFKDLVKLTHKTSLTAQQYQDLDVKKIVHDLGYAGETAFTPLTQIVFAFEETNEGTYVLGKHRGEKLPLMRQQAAFDLECSLVKKKDGPLDVFWVYSDALFEAETITAFAKTFEIALQQLLTMPERPLKEISLADHALLIEPIPEQQTPLSSFADMFEARAAQNPTAVACKWRAADGLITSQSYAELNIRANGMARALVAHGVTSDTPVAICVGSLSEAIVNLVAVQKVGAAYVILDPAIPSERNQAMYTQAGCHCAIGQILTEQLPQDAQVVAKNAEPHSLNAKRDSDIDPAAKTAIILFTSGSTGTPKGVELSHAAVANHLHAAQEQLQLDEQDCFAVASTLTFDAHIFEIYLALSFGGSVALLDPARARDAAFLQEDQQAFGIRFLFATPTSWQFLRDANWSPLDGMTLITGGESLSKQLSDDLLKSARDVRLVNVYGPSEATVFNLCGVMSADEPVHLGYPLSRNVIYLQDTYGHPCPPSCRGEIVIAGAQVALGYLGPEPGFFHGPAGHSYATGDIASRDADGRFLIVGREDFQVKINGVRLELDEISAALEQHPLVRRATITLTRNRDDVARLAAYVEALCEQSGIATLLSRYLTTIIPRSHLPSSYTVLERLPVTPSGKIDRKALPPPVLDIALSTGRAPETALEVSICAIWSALLERSVDDVDLGFFELGGHSLLAIKMINQLNRTCGADLKMRDVVGALTVADLALRIGNGERSAEIEDIPISDNPLPAPLSFAQERIWTIDQIEASGAYYTIPMIYDVKGAGFNHGKASDFLTALIAKHTILSTVYLEEDGKVIQDSVATAVATFEFVDASSRLNQTEVLATVEQSCLNEPFDLRNGPMLRSCLVKLGDDNHRWFIALHHIAFDGTSLALFVQELTTYLTQGTLGNAATPSYADYARWQRETHDLGPDLQFWKQRLHAAPAVHQLDFDRPRSSDQSFRGETMVQKLDATLTNSLRILAAETNTTEFSALFALFAAYLQLRSGENDIVLGTPVANRQNPALENTIGCFVNTVPLRSQLDPNENFTSLLRRTNTDLQNDLSHDGVPFEKLVEAVCDQRSFAYNPIFQIMIQLDNSDSHGFSVADTKFTACQPKETEAKFDLTLGLRLGNNIDLSWNYATDLFDQKTIHTMMVEFEDCVKACVSNPYAPLNVAAPVAKTTPSFDGPIRDVSSDTLSDRFLAAAQAHPDRTAVFSAKQELTYRQLETRARALADALADQGIGQNMLVGLHISRSVELVVAMIACSLCGCAYLPLDPAYPATRLQSIVAAACPAIVLCADGFSDYPAAQFDLLRKAVRLAETGYQPRNIPTFTAYVIYTSGSTGQPKGVQVGHESLVNFVDWITEDIGIEDTARVLQVTSPSFDISVTEILVPLCIGGAVVIGSAMIDGGAKTLVNEALEREVSVLQMVPGMLQAFMDAAGKTKFPAVTHILCGGETVPARLLKAAQNSFPIARIFAVYGPTEATVWASAYDFTAVPTDGPIPLGTPASNTCFEVFDDNGHPTPLGRTGSLFIGGTALAQGYLHDTERTAASFITESESDQRLYQTGDLVRIAPDNQMIFVGRDDS